MGKTLVYIRVSDDKQGVKNQRHEILEASKLKDIKIDDFISITMTSRKTSKQRRIDEVLQRLEGRRYPYRHQTFKAGTQHRRNNSSGEWTSQAWYSASCSKTEYRSQRRPARYEFEDYRDCFFPLGRAGARFHQYKNKGGLKREEKSGGNARKAKGNYSETHIPHPKKLLFGYQQMMLLHHLHSG